MEQRFRLYGLDTPELGTEEGSQAKAFLVKLMTEANGKVLLRVGELDKFRRYVAIVWRFSDSGALEEKSINQQILDQGLAVVAADHAHFK